jgi:hypothetical protein
MKTFIAVGLLLAMTVPAFATEETTLTPAGRTVTPAQWKDIHELYEVFPKCGGQDDDPEFKKTCARSHKLQRKLIAQGFCTYAHIAVGRAGRQWTQKEWEQDTGSTDPVPKDLRDCCPLYRNDSLVPKNIGDCDALHVPTP